MLLLPEERRALLKKWGVDCLIECPFVESLAHMEAEDFVREILVKRLHVKYLAVGTDFHFGHNRKGSYQLLEAMQEECGFEVEVVEKACYDGEEISSTRIRRELEQGHMELVNQLLGYNFSVTGEVLHGRQIGRTLGLPTTNLLPPQVKLLPPNGVYLTRTIPMDGEEWEYYGITNIGYKPTVGATEQKGVETYLFDYNGDLYGRKLRVEFLEFERPEQKFESLEVLKRRILSDVNWGKSKIKQKKPL